MDISSVMDPDALLRALDALPPTAPFTSALARREGVSYAVLRRLVARGLLVHPVRGVYHSPSLPDSLELRIEVLKQIVPERAVVTDRTAAWVLGGVRVLAPGAHMVVPEVSMFCLPGSRLRNKLVASGQRSLLTSDILTLDGVRVTTPLRTACDVGRLLHRDQAIGVMDALAATGGLTPGRLSVESRRFSGFRGVVQLRALAPLVDAASGSPGESTLRLRWYDIGLPRPQCQVQELGATGGPLFIDVGLADHRLGAEYFGEEFHGPADLQHDEDRLTWLRDERGWVIVVARKHNVYGHDQDVEGPLAAAARQVGLLR